MIDTEVLALLTWAALLDPRLKRVDEIEAADRAEAWADLLADVDLAEAKEAVRAHYSVAGAAPILPGDILAAVRPDAPSPYRNVTADLVARSEQLMLEQAGVTRADVDAARARGDVDWIRAHFPDFEITPAQLQAFEQRRRELTQ